HPIPLFSSGGPEIVKKNRKRPYPDKPLLPADAAQRAEVLELEEQFDRLGVHVRRWLYGQIKQWDSVMHAMLKVYRPLLGLSLIHI
ncbi:hypothetical protein ACQ4LH_21640, partial [Pseudomonas peli]